MSERQKIGRLIFFVTLVAPAQVAAAAGFGHAALPDPTLGFEFDPTAGLALGELLEPSESRPATAEIFAGQQDSEWNANLLDTPEWSWGPVLGIGLRTPPRDDADGFVSSYSPALLLTGQTTWSETPRPRGASFGFEFGSMHRLRLSESLEDRAGGAFYVAMMVHVEF